MASRSDRPEIEATVRLFTALPTRDQLEAYAILGEYLSHQPGGDNRGEKERRRRRESLEAIRTVAKHLRLPDGLSPTRALEPTEGDWDASHESDAAMAAGEKPLAVNSTEVILLLFAGGIVVGGLLDGTSLRLQLSKVKTYARTGYSCASPVPGGCEARS